MIIYQLVFLLTIFQHFFRSLFFLAHIIAQNRIISAAASHVAALLLKVSAKKKPV